MPRNLKMIDIFVSSPSDVNHERQLIVDVARDWNSLHSRRRSCHLNVLTWEDAVAPALGSRAQDAINQQIGDQYDVYLGVMWSKFGVSTGLADSGTVEEFERALDRYKGGDRLRLAMMFKTADVPTAQLDGLQYAKVQDFKKRFSDEGGLYREFLTDEDLRLVANRIFNQAADELESWSEPSLSSVGAIVKADSASGAGAQAVDDEEMGFIEAQQKLTEVAERQSQFLSGWVKLMGENTALTSQILDNFNTLTMVGNINPKAVNDNMRMLASSLDTITDYLSEGISGYIEGNDEIARLIYVSIDIAGDFDDEAQRHKIKSDAADLRNGIVENYGSTESLNENIKAIPRLSGIFNKSRNRILRVHGRMIEENQRLEKMLNTILES